MHPVNRNNWKAQLIAMAVVIAVSLAILLALIAKGQWFYGAQAYRYHYLLGSFREAVDAGIGYPRWLPDLMGGYGYPTFVYYQPGFFFLALPFTYLFSDLVHALTAALLFMLALGGMGMYMAARQFTHATGAICCAVLFLLTPYIPFMLYARGSLSELLGVLLCPWLFHFMLRLQQQWPLRQVTWHSCIGFSLSGAALLYSHPMVAAYALMAIAALLLLVRQCRNRGFLGLVGCCGLLALALSGAYWIPVLQLYDAASWGRAHRIVTMDWPQLLFLGSGHLAFAVFLLLRFRNDRLMQALAVVITLLLLLLSPAGQGLWGHALVAHYTAMLQMTYRVLGVLSVLLLLMVARGMTYFAEPSRIVFWTLTALLLSYGTANRAADFYQRHWPSHLFSYSRALSLFAPAPMHDRHRLPKGWKHKTWFEDSARYREKIQSGISNMTHTGEFFPKGAKVPRSSRFRDNIPYARGDFLSLGSSGIAPYRLSMELDIPDATAPGPLVIHQYRFPGWQVKVDGVDLPPEALHQTKEGFIAVDIAASGKHTVAAWYDGPPGWRMRNLCMALAAMVALAGMRYILRGNKRQGHVW